VKRFVIILISVLALIGISQYLLLPLFLRHQQVQEKLQTMISEETKGTVQFSDLSLRVFPSLAFQMRGVEYQSRNKAEPLSFHAEKINARLELLPLLQRKIKIKDLRIENASLEGKNSFIFESSITFSVERFSY